MCLETMMPCGFEIPTLGSIIIVVNYQLADECNHPESQPFLEIMPQRVNRIKRHSKKLKTTKKNPFCGLWFLMYGNSSRRQENTFCGNFGSKARRFCFWPRLPQSAHLVTSKLPNNYEDSAVNTFCTLCCGNEDLRTMSCFVFVFRP